MSLSDEVHLLPTLPVDVARLRLTVRAERRLTLPFFAGSMLRGAFGHSLRRLVCMTRSPKCDGCPLRASCPFPRLFDPFGIDIAVVGLPAGSAQPPPPFALEPPPMGAAIIETGQSWTFGLRLFGKAIRDLPLVIEAWRRALLAGLGATPAQGHLTAAEFYEGEKWSTIYDPETAKLEEISGTRSSVLIAPVDFGDVVMKFVTPLRLQSNAHRLNREAITARRLVSDVVRRARLIAVSAGGSDAHAVVAGWPIRVWLEEAERSEITQTLRWVDWTRQSSRQQQFMTLGGWVGSIRIAKVAPAVLAALEMGEQTGVGKETVFGFGRYCLSAQC